MKNYKYFREADNRAKCPVLLECEATGKRSYLPTYGITAYSDNTCTWHDFAAFCRRVGLKKADIDELATGDLCVRFYPICDEFGGVAEIASIGVEDPPNHPHGKWVDRGGCGCSREEWQAPTLWIW